MEEFPLAALLGVFVLLTWDIPYVSGTKGG